MLVRFVMADRESEESCYSRDNANRRAPAPGEVAPRPGDNLIVQKVDWIAR
jgi:hypothetical protein